MKVSEIMSRNPRTVTAETPIHEAARMMKDENVGILPVVEKGNKGKLVGVVTDRDIAVRCVAKGHDSSKCMVKEAMSTDVKTCLDTDTVDKLMDTMGREQIRRVPIIDERGSLVGVVAQADIVKKADDGKAERTVEKISKASGKHSQ